ncbi:MAG: polyprenyl synthetase family protein [Chloroflexota bacterium]|nr:polyprenyl synthetase family protein [Chloroflexota bacterium]
MLRQDSHAIYTPLQRRQDVLACAEALVRTQAEPDQRQLLETALIGLQDPVLDDPPLLLACVHLPLLVHAALVGDDAPAVPLAALLALLHLGIDIFDDLADGDLPAHWAGWHPSAINLAAATLLSALPQLALAELDAPSATLVAMQRTLAQGLMRMSAGQQRDLAMVGAYSVSAQDIEALVVAKSGEELALFAALAAQFAGMPSEVVAIAAALGRALGTGRQIAEDCYDLFTASHSRDLANGTRTLPLALYLARQRPEEAGSFLDLLAQARVDRVAQGVVRQRLREAGVLRHCAVIVEIYCQQARRLLAQLNAQEPGYRGLQAMISTVSFFPDQHSVDGQAAISDG